METNPTVRRRLLNRIFWEYDYSISEIEHALASQEQLPLKQSVLVKLLESTNWYELKKALTDSELREALSAPILQKLRSQSLKNKYAYAAKLLFE